jgi:hypothetical protein
MVTRQTNRSSQLPSPDRRDRSVAEQSSEGSALFDAIAAPRQLDEKTAESNLGEARIWLGLLDGVDYMQHCRRVLIAARKLAEK